MSDDTTAFSPYDVPGIGTVLEHMTEGYRVQLLDGRVIGATAVSGTCCEANAAADIAYALANPPTLVPEVEEPAIGTRRALADSFSHVDVSTLAGVTLIGILPWGWAPVDFQAWVDEAFDAGRTISVGTAGSSSRYVSGLSVSTVGFKQATPLQLTPLSAPDGTPIFLKKSAATATGNIIKASLIIERKYIQ